MKDLVLKNLGFSYEGSERSLLENLSLTFPSGWTGIVGPNGCGKSTLLKILTGKLKPTIGEVQGNFSFISYCEQDTLEAPQYWQDFCDSFDKQAIQLKTSLGLHNLLNRSWTQLSHGERKRFQIGCALIQDPDLLLIDEPTNHLDAPNRTFLIKSLQRFKGVGIVISHDRELLNALAKQCLFYDGGTFVPLSGNYEESKIAIDSLHESRTRKSENLEQKVKSASKEIERLASLDSASKNRLSKRNLAKDDHDAKAKLDLARITSKDSSLGKRKAQLESRVKDLRQEILRIQTTKDYSGPIFFTADHPDKKLLLSQGSLQIDLLDATKLHTPELLLYTGQKVGLIGPNGTGKSSLLRYLSDGTKFRTEKFLYLKQELTKQETKRINNLLEALPGELYSRCLQIVARLGSDAKQVFSSSHRSPGEIRKIAIALAIVGDYDLLILDEPTNHLDLPSIERLEDALASSPLALLLVSHDNIFINAVCETTWEISRLSHGDSELIVI